MARRRVRRRRTCEFTDNGSSSVSTTESDDDEGQGWQEQGGNVLNKLWAKNFKNLGRHLVDDNNGLRGLQEKIVQKVVEKWKAMEESGSFKPIVIVCPTGFGKKYIAGAINFYHPPKGRVLCACHWQILNVSNAEFYSRAVLKNYLPTSKINLIDRAVSVLTANVDKPNHYAAVWFYGVRKLLNSQKSVKSENWARSFFDECQLIPRDALTITSSFADENAYLSAFPCARFMERVENAEFEYVEVTMAECIQDKNPCLKVPRLIIVRDPDGDLDVAPEDTSEIYHGGEAVRRLMNAVLFFRDKATADLCSQLNVQVLPQEHTVGIIVQCDCLPAGEAMYHVLVKEAENNQSLQLKPNQIAMVNGKLTPAGSKAHDDVLKRYKSGEIVVVIVCRMWVVGLHFSRTCIFATTKFKMSVFDDGLQGFGRALSVDDSPHRAAYFIAGSSWYDRMKFQKRFETYFTKGVLGLWKQDRDAFRFNVSKGRDEDDESVREPEESDIASERDVIHWKPTVINYDPDAPLDYVEEVDPHVTSALIKDEDEDEELNVLVPRRLKRRSHIADLDSDSEQDTELAEVLPSQGDAERLSEKVGSLSPALIEDEDEDEEVNVLVPRRLKRRSRIADLDSDSEQDTELAEVLPSQGDAKQLSEKVESLRQWKRFNYDDNGNLGRELSDEPQLDPVSGDRSDEGDGNDDGNGDVGKGGRDSVHAPDEEPELELDNDNGGDWNDFCDDPEDVPAENDQEIEWESFRREEMNRLWNAKRNWPTATLDLDGVEDKLLAIAASMRSQLGDNVRFPSEYMYYKMLEAGFEHTGNVNNTLKGFLSNCKFANGNRKNAWYFCRPEDMEPKKARRLESTDQGNVFSLERVESNAGYVTARNKLNAMTEREREGVNKKLEKLGIPTKWKIMKTEFNMIDLHVFCSELKGAKKGSYVDVECALQLPHNSSVGNTIMKIYTEKFPKLNHLTSDFKYAAVSQIEKGDGKKKGEKGTGREKKTRGAKRRKGIIHPT